MLLVRPTSGQGVTPSSPPTKTTHVHFVLLNAPSGVTETRLKFARGFSSHHDPRSTKGLPKVYPRSTQDLVYPYT